ncbi:MAG: FAD-dependent monooxygenase [Pedobacter sp.]|uniref:FAD-dependent monooxygenase n=1 Tax=Pedobacter sp. TaxID=1411316 RepID=UPI003396FD47
MKATAEQSSQYDVIISGAGPVGLFLACELALAGCSVLILEKAENPDSALKQLPFGIRGLSTPSIEALDRRGLLQELELHKRMKNPHSVSTNGGKRQVGHFAGIPLYEDDINASQWKYRLPDSSPTSLISEMQELETVLSSRAATLGVTIKRGFAITDFHQDLDGLTVYSEDRCFAGKWLVGCDGSRSIVRKAGGFIFAGTEPEFTGYTARVEIADPEKLGAGRIVTSTGMYMQSQPGYIIIQDFDDGVFHSSGHTVTLDHIQEVLRRVSKTDVTIDALHIATTWTDRARQATTYRDGRVLLAGDAAHIHAPLGGQGLNLGLGDAMNLGWKLAATVLGKAPEGLLDSYYTERHPVGAQVLDWSRAQVTIMKPDPHARALNAIIRDLMNTGDGATYIAGRIWGIFTNYHLDGDHPLTGYSVPDFEFEDGTRISMLMHGAEGLLLDFNANPLLEAMANDYTVRYISGRATEQLGLSAVLVRPDGFIAWACDQDTDLAEARRCASRWFTID